MGPEKIVRCACGQEFRGELVGVVRRHGLDVHNARSDDRPPAGTAGTT